MTKIILDGPATVVENTETLDGGMDKMRWKNCDNVHIHSTYIEIIN